MNCLIRETFSMAVIDSGCTKTVAGMVWVREYISTLTKEQSKSVITYKNTNVSFKFGDGKQVKSIKRMEFPVKIGCECFILRTEIVRNDIPLLLSREAMAKGSMVINFKEDTLSIGESNRVKLYVTSTGHYAVPLSQCQLSVGARHSEIVLHGSDLDGLSVEQKMKKAVKLHRQLSHPTTQKLVDFVKNSKYSDPEFLDCIKRCCEECSLCLKYKKAPLKPVVSVPIANDFNQVVCMDLKEYIHVKVWIFHLIDASTRYSAACLIRSKHRDTVVERIFRIWIAYFGSPGKILTDNGGEFSNEDVRELNEKLNVVTMTTAGESPFSNGIVERHNKVLYETMLKTKEEVKCSAEVALAWAVSSKNALQNNNGFSPNQLVFGRNTNLPTVLSDKLPALEPTTSSDTVRTNLQALHSARKNYLEAENSDRIKRALRHQVRTFSDVKYENGDKVYYKRNKVKGWKGPGVVLGQDGKLVLVRHGGAYYRVHPCQLLHVELSEGQTSKLATAANRTMSKNPLLGKGTKIAAAAQYWSDSDDSDEEQNNENIEDHDLDETDDEDEVNGDDDDHDDLDDPDNSDSDSDHDDHGDNNLDHVHEDLEGQDNPDDQDDSADQNENQDEHNLDNESCSSLDELNGNSSGSDESEHNTSDNTVMNTSFDSDVYISTEEHIDNPIATEADHQTTSKKEEALVFPKSNSRITFELDNKTLTGVVLSTQPKRSGINGHWVNVHLEEDEKPIAVNWRDISSWKVIPAAENVVYFSKVDELSQEVVDAKDREIQQLIANNVIEIVANENQRTISAKWVFTEKVVDNRKVTKARLVARGFEEVCNNLRTDSPTISRQALRVVLLAVVTNKWVLQSLDVLAAFLQSNEIERNVYIKPPKEMCPDQLLWKLKRPLYGLKDAPREWYKRLTQEIKRLGGKLSAYDKALYLWHCEETLVGIIISHVDDIMYGGTKVWIDRVIGGIEHAFKISRMDAGVFNYIGIDVCQRENDVIIDQTAYVNNITPISITKERKTNKDAPLTPLELSELRSVNGQLLWVTGMSRPDMSFLTCQVSNYGKNATVRNLIETNKAIRKLKSAKVCLKFPKLNIQGIQVLCFADAAHGNLPSGASQGGYVVFLYDNKKVAPITWQSKKLSRVTKSPMASEALALGEAVDSGYLIAAMVREMFALPTQPLLTGLTDNVSLKDTLYTTNIVDDRRLRVDIARLREMIELKELNVDWIPKENQLADCATKNGACSANLLEVLQTSSVEHFFKV